MADVYHRFAAAEKLHQNRLCVIVENGGAFAKLTYAEMGSVVQQAAAMLVEAGVERGDSCAILSDNNAEWCAAYIGILRQGAVAVPLDVSYSVSQIRLLLSDAHVQYMFVDRKHMASAREAVGLSGETKLLSLETLGCSNLNSVPHERNDTISPCSTNEEDPAAILYTSGTTADPKGIVLTHGNLLAEVDGLLERLPIDENDVVLGILPLYHALAQVSNLLVPLLRGGAVVYLRTVNTAAVLDAFQQNGITVFCCVPQFFYMIHQRVMEQVARARLPKRILFRGLIRLSGVLRFYLGINIGKWLFAPAHRVLGNTIRLLVTGGSRFDPKIARELSALGFDLLHVYGLSECSGAATLTRPGDQHMDSVGTALHGVDLKILHTNDGADGEIAVRGPIVMRGYLNRPDTSAEVLRDGWLHTGDLGYLDLRGRLFITGRKKDLIVLASGKNIYPEEIEAHYRQSPLIKEICVVGHTDPVNPLAERLYAVIVPNMDVMRDRKLSNIQGAIRLALEQFSTQLPPHKRVTSYEVWMSDLPRTTTRKVQRHLVAQSLRHLQVRGSQAVDPGQLERFSDDDAAWFNDPINCQALDAIAIATKRTDVIHPNASLELDLGLDSLQRVELLVSLEHTFGTRVPDAAAGPIFTVKELINAFRSSTGISTTIIPNGNAWRELLHDRNGNDIDELLESKPVIAGLTFLISRVFYILSILLLRFNATGRDNLNLRQPFVICPNHQSYLDVFLVVSILPFSVFRRLFFLGASKYYRSPVMRWLARRLNIVPIDPNSNLIRSMQMGAIGLRKGKVLVLFPEGERTHDGQIASFRNGVSILARELQVPIVPVGIHGTFDIWPRGRLPQRLARVVMKVGHKIDAPQISNAKMPPDDVERVYAEHTRKLRAAVLAAFVCAAKTRSRKN